MSRSYKSSIIRSIAKLFGINHTIQQLVVFSDHDKSDENITAFLMP
jgi:hypothetical protein